MNGSLRLLCVVRPTHVLLLLAFTNKHSLGELIYHGCSDSPVNISIPAVKINMVMAMIRISSDYISALM